MALKWEDIWREISNYVEGDLDPQLKRAMDEHFAGCAKCRAVLDGTRNVVQIYGDEKAFKLPPDFHPQLHRQLEARVQGTRTQGSAWILAVAAMVLLAASVWVATLHNRAVPVHHTLSPATAEQIKTLVVVAGDTKYFHLAGCPYIHGRQRTMFADQALREGLLPCDKCLKDLAQQLSGIGSILDNDVASKDPAMDAE